MEPISLHPIIFYSFLGFMLIVMSAAGYLYSLYNNTLTKDLVIFLDKSNRWRHIWDNIKDSETYSNNKKKYIVNAGIVNKKGKALYIYSDNKPAPMDIKYNSIKWLTSESLMAVINNNLIQKLVKPNVDFMDKLILFGAIGGMVGALSSIIILLKTTGII